MGPPSHELAFAIAMGIVARTGPVSGMPRRGSERAAHRLVEIVTNRSPESPYSGYAGGTRWEQSQRIVTFGALTSRVGPTRRRRGPPDRERPWAVPANLAQLAKESEHSSQSAATQHGERQIRQRQTNFIGTAVMIKTSPTNAEGNHDSYWSRLGLDRRPRVVVLALPLTAPY